MTSSTDDWMARYEADRREKIERVRSSRAVVMEILKDAGVAKAVVPFDGSGDSGQTEGVSLYGKAGKHLKAKKWDELLGRSIQGTERERWDYNDGEAKSVRRCDTLEEAIDELCYDILGSQHGGWEINEGSFGEFVFDVEKDEIALTFNERIESYETTEETF